MLTDSASSSHRSERVQKKKTSPASSTAATDDRSVARGGGPLGTAPPAVVSRAGASESTVMGSEGNTDGRRASTRNGRCSAPDVRNDVARERLEALRRREVAEPQHELATARVDELLHLLGDLLGGADEVVAHVLVVRSTAPHSEPPPGESSQRCMSASVSNTRQSGPCVRTIESKSRPISSQYCSSRPDLRTKPSMPVCQLVLSAWRASMRSVTFSPPPPIQISGSCWIGFGSQYAPSNARCLPWYVTVSSVQSRFIDLDRLVEDLQPRARRSGTG